MTDTIFTTYRNSEDPIWFIYKAYLNMKKYEGISEFEVPQFRVGISGRLRDLTRIWGNMAWKDKGVCED